MTVLVTGGAGYIGSHTVYELVQAGERVLVLDDLSSGRADLLPREAELVVGDVGDRSLVDALLRTRRVEAIVHFAGSIVVPESLRDPLAYYRNNTGNSCALLEAAVKADVQHFIFSSTAAVYGDPQASRITEDAPLAPVSPYGWSKLMTEVMLRNATAAYGLRHVVLRYFNVAGADPLLRTGQSTGNATHLIKVALQAALGLRPVLEVYGTDYPTPDGTCVRDYIHVADLACAHLAALDHLRRTGESCTLNCGYGIGHSVLEVIDAVRKAYGRDFPVRMAQRRPGDPAILVAEPRRMHDLVAWQPRWNNLDMIVNHALAWERKLAAAAAKPKQVPLS